MSRRGSRSASTSSSRPSPTARCRSRRARRSSSRPTQSTGSPRTSGSPCSCCSTAAAAGPRSVRVFVTGATGFLGRHLVPLLVERGDDIVALVRPATEASWLEERGVRIVRGELLGGDAVPAARGAELVFHLAGVVAHERRDLSRLVRGNVEGLRLALEAAPSGARFVHVSSVAAIGPAPAPDRPATEEQPFPLHAGRYPYAATKREGEA